MSLVFKTSSLNRSDISPNHCLKDGITVSKTVIILPYKIRFVNLFSVLPLEKSREGDKALDKRAIIFKERNSHRGCFYDEN